MGRERERERERDSRSFGRDKYSSVWIGWGGRKEGRNLSLSLSLSPVTQIRTNTRQKVEGGKEKGERSDLETDRQTV